MFLFYVSIDCLRFFVYFSASPGGERNEYIQTKGIRNQSTCLFPCGTGSEEQKNKKVQWTFEGQFFFGWGAVGVILNGGVVFCER